MLINAYFCNSIAVLYCVQIEHLKALLVSESEQGGDRSENERQLVMLIKSAQEEREELLLRLCELYNSTQVRPAALSC